MSLLSDIPERKALRNHTGSVNSKKNLNCCLHISQSQHSEEAPSQLCLEWGLFFIFLFFLQTGEFGSWWKTSLLSQHVIPNLYMLSSFQWNTHTIIYKYIFVCVPWKNNIILVWNDMRMSNNDLPFSWTVPLIGLDLRFKVFQSIARTHWCCTFCADSVIQSWFSEVRLSQL